MLESVNYKQKLEELFCFMNDDDSKNLTIQDYQYSLILYYQCLFHEEEDLTKDVLISLYSLLHRDLEYQPQKNSLKKIDELFPIKNINDLSNYFIIFYEMEKELSENNSISLKLKNIIESFLTEINNSLEDISVEPMSVISQYENININENTTEDNIYSQSCIDCSIEYPVNNNFERLNSNYLKDFLISKNKIKNECFNCGLETWQNKPLQLIINFLDGDKNNQDINNITLLCPNCFSQIGHE